MKRAFRLLTLSCAVAAFGCGERAAEPPAAVSDAALVDVPRPDLVGLPDEARTRLEGEREALDRRLSEAPSPELGAAFGEMGRLYHAYGLREVALAAYENAHRLAGDEIRWAYLAGVLEEDFGRPTKAAAWYESVLAARADDVPALLRLAEMRIQLNESGPAAEALRRALAVSESSVAHVALGRLATARQDHAAAVEHFRRALEIEPGADSVHYLLGLAYQRSGDTEAARRHVALRGTREASFEDPLLDGLKDLVSGAGPHLDRAILLFAEGRYDEAAAEYQAACDLDPGHPTALRGVGFSLRAAGRLDEAEKALAEMLEIYPGHALARMELATVLLEKDSLPRAVEEYRKILELDPSFKEAWLDLGVALARSGDWTQAVTCFEKTLELEPRNAQARYSLAMAREKQDRRDDALAELRRLVTEHPDHVAGRERLGVHLEERGDLAGADEQYQAVVDLADAPARDQALAHYQLGRLHRLRGEGDSAEHFEEALRLFPQLWQAHYALANLDRDAGRYREAALGYARVSAGDPTKVTARASEAEAWLAAGEYGVARRRLEEGLQALPRAAELGHLLARVLATAPDDRLRDGRRALELAHGIWKVLPSLEHAETVAMAMAETGRFDDAVTWQRKIIERAQSEGRGDALPRLRQNLELYLRKERVRG